MSPGLEPLIGDSGQDPRKQSSILGFMPLGSGGSVTQHPKESYQGGKTRAKPQLQLPKTWEPLTSARLGGWSVNYVVWTLVLFLSALRHHYGGVLFLSCLWPDVYLRGSVYVLRPLQPG